MKPFFILMLLWLSFSCDDGANKKSAYVPESSGNINHVTVVMPEKDWKASLGEKVKSELQEIYEGLPLDEPQFSLVYMNPKAFTGFARQNRNIIWFRKDSLEGFRLSQNQFARPQILATITGIDTESQAFYFQENTELLKQTLIENERKEKLRRIMKSPTTENTLSTRFGIELTYPSAYKTFKDTTNFVWIQKEVRKGHLNLIAYTLKENILEGSFNERILNIRDSIGKAYVPGRLDGSYQITERAFRPYFYRAIVDGKQAYLTKGTWEVANDYMAGPFVNYMIQDTLKNRILVVEGFVFAPTASKRDYMFELNTIINTLKQVD
ncbi:DUF4837 family protein [Flavobacteriaceae bacterium]|jgi:hypothetical protein|nr:DUF4837 family protein [Flavobacteriaceae bacterium]MDA9893580.1 DUF4837 family protein [Flavobacteriaceae bacterium]MDB2340302.1 DUF4837 family protein [Flavobacteriaceae bacterium]MDC1055928.1 DUF4837 family protein [Flavobacteriaceae bacterium]